MSTLKIEYLIKVDIKAIRIGKGLTLRAMSRKIGMDASNYSKMERGKAGQPLKPVTGGKTPATEGQEALEEENASRGIVEPKTPYAIIVDHLEDTSHEELVDMIIDSKNKSELKEWSEEITEMYA